MNWLAHSRYIALLLFLATASYCYGQHSEDWLSLSPKDWAIREAPGDPDATAVQLYYADFRDDNSRYEFVHRCIKVLSDQGRGYADVEIIVPKEYRFEDLQARTIHPDGSVVPFTGKPFDKVVLQYREDKTVAKAFTLPSVISGSIIEYKYRLTWDLYFHDPVWYVQHDLFTFKESFWLRPYKGPLSTPTAGDRTQLSFVYSNMPEGIQPRDTSAGVELELENVPAFKAERYMPPEDNFKAEVRFFYGGHEVESPEAFWNNLGHQWYAKSERFIGSYSEIKRAAARIAGAETNPGQKLRKLYAYAQQIRNLSFERARTSTEDKKEDLKPNASVADVLARGYGYQNEIAELFVALARAAGFQAGLLRASSRKDRIFDIKLLSENQLDAEIAEVMLNGSALYLDPGTRFCPFGTVHWIHTSTTALKLNRNGGARIVVPTATADKSVMRRAAQLELDAAGTLHGQIEVEFKGTDALERRLDALDSDTAGRTRDLEDELLSWLPQGSGVLFLEAQGWDSSEDPLVAAFEVEVPRFASVAGKRLVIPAGLFRLPQMSAFQTTDRKYPLYFPYTYEELDNVTIHLPPGYSVETLPDGQDVKLSSTRFITSRSVKEGAVLETRALVVNSIYFQPQQYAELREFFNRLKATGEEQVVAVPAGAK